MRSSLVSTFLSLLFDHCPFSFQVQDQLEGKPSTSYDYSIRRQQQCVLVVALRIEALYVRYLSNLPWTCSNGKTFRSISIEHCCKVHPPIYSSRIPFTILVMRENRALKYRSWFICRFGHLGMYKNQMYWCFILSILFFLEFANKAIHDTVGCTPNYILSPPRWYVYVIIWV